MDYLLKNASIFTGYQWVENGYIEIRNGQIITIGTGKPKQSNLEILDLNGATVTPGIVDCHTHLMEFAAMGVEKARGSAQALAGHANLLKALQAGVTSLGEHILGHPVLRQPLDVYREIASLAPQDVLLCTGWCVVGTDPLTILAAKSTGQIIGPEELTPELTHWLAENSQFAGESIFLTATVANLPEHLVPRGGELFLDSKAVKQIIGIFHTKGKPIGAHIQGDEAVRDFVGAGGDVVHHGHEISNDTIHLLARQNVQWVITPHGGTAAPPTPPEQIALAVELGLQPALASDSYLPAHRSAQWLTQGLEPENEIGPREFMTVINNLAGRLLELGVPREEIFRMLTLYPARVLGLEGRLGSLEPGKQADIIVTPGLWGIEVKRWQDIILVLKRGEIVIAK